MIILIKEEHMKVQCWTSIVMLPMYDRLYTLMQKMKEELIKM